MRLTTLVAALSLGAVTTSSPTTQDRVDDGTYVGRACTGVNFGGTCMDLIATEPNTCFMSKHGQIPLDDSIRSLEVAVGQHCAFFSLEVCIAPEGDPKFYVSGPATYNDLSKVRTGLRGEIQAYVCGQGAKEYATRSLWKRSQDTQTEIVRRDVDGVLPQGSRRNTL